LDSRPFVHRFSSCIAGVWPTFEEALEGGHARFGLDAFMVKQIRAAESVHLVNRDILPSPI